MLHVRSVSLTYGFTTVNGRFIKTGRIQSPDGSTYFDLDAGEIGGKIVFDSNGQEKTLEELGQESLDAKNYIDNTLPGILNDLRAQLDGQIEQFFYEYDPTTSNIPAKEWTTTTLKENHLGDLFYNTATGKVFRWVKKGTVYKWKELQDSEVANALALANDALALAREKEEYSLLHQSRRMKSGTYGSKVLRGILCVVKRIVCPVHILQAIGKRHQNTLRMPL